MFNSPFSNTQIVKKKAVIGMTPLIDMVFILLIFFVATTSFNRETGIVVRKARASTSEALQKDLIVVSIDSVGQYWHDNRTMNLGPLITEVAEKLIDIEDASVVIIPDESSDVAPLIKLMDRLRAAEVYHFSIGTEKVELVEESATVE